jgi:REP element-mobilizing transposase RayT
MPQSFARIVIHLIFSTKGRQSLLKEHVHVSLHSYMATVLKNFNCPPILINSVEDHAHLLIEMARTVSVSAVVEEVKTTSSRWIKTQGPEFAKFAWQSGYGAFSVSESGVDAVRDYIANQREHHRRYSFQEEYRAFMKKHGIEFDEKYGWD